MKVFLSYSDEDRKVAQALVSELAKAGLEPWDPAEALFPGDNWASRIGKALQESDAMVVLVSPASMKSEWVLHEVEFALGSPRYKSRLIPVVLKPTKDMPWIFKKLPTIQIGRDLARSLPQIAQHIERELQLTPANT